MFNWFWSGKMRIIKLISVTILLLLGLTFSVDAISDDSLNSLSFKASHKSVIKAAVVGEQNIRTCQTIKSARRWLQTRWPENSNEESLAPAASNVLQAVRKRIVQLNDASRAKPKTSFQKLAVFFIRERMP
jgi:hypothetical protein